MKKNGLIITIFVHKSKDEHVRQLVNTEDGHLQQNYTLSKFQKLLQVIHFRDAIVRTTRYNE